MAVKSYENLDMIEAAKRAGFSLLLHAVKKSGLEEVLKSSEYITVFAPDDNAFNALDKRFLEDILKFENREKLLYIIKYHMVSSAMSSGEVEGVDDIMMMNGKKAEIFKQNGDLMINDSKIIEPDIKTKNGIIHTINKVLIP